MESKPQPPAGRAERLFIACLLGGLLWFALWGVAGGWGSRALMGNGFRQAQTAITALFVQREHNFSLAYPTPVLGKPWSVPFEFPLYQWTVVVVSDVTGLSLIKCGRLVSAACFFLSLPALWLLLRRMGEERRSRAVALGLVLTCPLLLFYARAFLIETMALMFSLWFLVAFVAAVEGRRYAWLAVANVAGVGAGLVKVTTFAVYLVPAALWAAWWCVGEWRRGRDAALGNRWRRLLPWLGWCAGATALPLAAMYAWLRFSDQVKMLNPGARRMASGIYGYVFGGGSFRADPAIWASHVRTTLAGIMPLWGLAALVVLAVLHCRGRRLAWLVGCAGLFVAAPAVFPVLYAWHEYYFVAVAVLPMLGAGLVLGAVLERRDLSRPRVWATVLVVLAVQVHAYLRTYRPQQLEDPRGASDLAEALRYATAPDDVLVIAGEDWSSVTPFYAQRRALMVRRDMERDNDYVDESFASLAGERVAALVLRGAQRENRMLLDKAVACFGLDPAPVFRWRDALVYVPGGKAEAVTTRIRQLELGEIESLRGGPVSSGEPVLWAADSLTEAQKKAFVPMGRSPSRFLSQFGVGTGELDGRACTGVHPTTRLWFQVPPGRHAVTVEFVIMPGAYAGSRREDGTDGVEFVVAAARGDQDRRVLFSRLLNPFDDPADRGWQRETVTVELAAGEELVLETLPGPGGNLFQDWSYWGRLDVR